MRDKDTGRMEIMFTDQYKKGMGKQPQLMIDIWSFSTATTF